MSRLGCAKRQNPAKLVARKDENAAMASEPLSYKQMKQLKQASEAAQKPIVALNNWPIQY
eukprot:567182-Lingulodinium_polyedra.AAC.1